MKVAAIQRVGSRLRFLAQTRLPGREEYLELDDYKEIIAAMKRLDIRGAPAIGIAAAYGMAIAVQQGRRYDMEYLGRIASDFKSIRPTAVNLSWAVDRVMTMLEKTQPSGLEETLRLLWAEAEAIHDEDRRMCGQIGKYGAQLINDGDAVLTHCNAGALATGGIGTALAVIYTCRDQGKRIKVFADETRPLLQGARLTAWELQKEGVDVTLICDSVAGMLMKQGKIDSVIVGADRIARNGDVANKIGTYSVAVLAERHDVPFYVAAPSSTLDPDTEDGDAIALEERPPQEVTEGLGRCIAPEGVAVYSPAFDVTPRSLVTMYITDKGIKPGGRSAAKDS